ncbi:unnamed protein product, partial [Coregonus sp. 'balchen']
KTTSLNYIIATEVRGFSTCFHLILLFLCSVEVTGEQQYGGLGGEITLTPKVSGQPEDILWKHNGNKVVEFDGSQNVEYGRYKGRTVLDWDSGELSIKGLTDADSGPYELEAAVKGKLQYSQHEVDVIDDVAQPSVTCVVNITTPEKSDRTLLCSADLQPLTKFIWRSPGGSVSPGPELFIAGGENQESVYTCVVKNPVSEKTAEFTLKDCYAEEGSSSVLAVILSILILLVLVAVLVLLWRWRKGKKPAEAALRKSEEEAVLMKVTVQGHVKEVIELFNKQDADANSKQHTAPTGRILSPTKSGGHIPLDRQNDRLSDKQTETEPVQDKPTPAQPDLVTPDPTLAQPDPVTPDPTLAQPDPVTPVPTLAQPDPVTPVPTLAQPDPVTPDPTPAQPDLITLDPTLAQPDTTVTILGQPDPGTSESTLAQPDPSIPEPKEAQLGHVKEVIELFNKQDADANRKQHTAPTGRILSPTKSGGHIPLDRQTDTEPVQDKPTPAQSDLVTPDPTLAQPDPVTPVPTPAQPDLITPDPTLAQPDPVTPVPTPAQPDPVTPVATLAQPDLITPDPTLAQPDLVTPEPALAQPDLVTTEPVPAQPDSSRPNRPKNKRDSSRQNRPKNKRDGSRQNRPKNKRDGSRQNRPKNKRDGSRQNRPKNKRDGSRQNRPKNKKDGSRPNRPKNKRDGSRQTRPKNKKDRKTDPITRETAPGQTDPITRETAPGKTDPRTRETAPGQTDSADTTETAPGKTDPLTRETAPGQTDSAGTTDPATAQKDPGTTRPEEVNLGTNTPTPKGAPLNAETEKQGRQVDAKNKVDVGKDGKTNHNQRDWKEGKQK